MKTIIWFYFILCLATVVLISDGAPSYKILAFLSFPSKSHHRVFEPLLKELAKRGHQVTVVTPLPSKETIPNYKEFVFKNYLIEVQNSMEAIAGTSDHREFLKMKGFVHQVMLFMMRQMGTVVAKLTFNDPTIVEFLQTPREFDAVITESSFMQEMNVALAHKYNAVQIEVLTAANFHWQYWLFGNPYDTSYIPDLSTPLSDRMSFGERLYNTFNSLMIRAIYRLYFMPVYEDLMNEFIRYPGWESRPPLMDLLSNTSLVLVNSHPSINYPHPMAPHFKEIGGINIVPGKKMNKELQDFMDSAKNGVIYFSLGSNFNFSKVSDEETVTGLVKLFGSLPQKVLWKYDEPLKGLSSNVKLSNWFPQQEILAHKNCKLFITHGGFLSMTEAIYYGVPMIGTPILGDQLKNTAFMEKKGFGIEMDFFNVSETSLKWAINKILTNPKYAENARKRSELFNDKPETALETAVYWTEYVIRHKGAYHLRPAITTMPWYQQAMIDVYGALLLITIIPLIIFYLIIRQIFRCICRCCGSSSSKRDKRKKE